VKKGVLSKLILLDLDEKELEHVTYGIYTRPTIFTLANFKNTSDCSWQRWTVDYQQDLDFVRKVFVEFRGRENEFTYREVNDFFMRNFGFQTQNLESNPNEWL
jgi:spore coat polysaccharide biosynthesis protein SpsF